MARRLALLALFLLAPACDCGGDDGPPTADGGDDGSPPTEGGPEAGPDGGLDGGVLGRPCEPGDPCDDGIDCTVDSCDEERERCRNQPDDHPCADEEFCNGNERCDRRLGCVPGPPLSCSDEDVCTIDTCDEELRDCIHSGRDFDGDGHVDWHCEGGDDCDDTNRRVFLGAREVCGDTFDNDCNGLTDDEEVCYPPGYDFCTDAIDATGGGAFELDMAGTFKDYGLGCGFREIHDAALFFVLDEPKAVSITAEAEGTLATVSLGSRCEDDLEADPAIHEYEEIECNWGFPGQIRRRNVEAGTYWIIVATNSDAPVVVRLSLSDPVPPPTNETCDSPIDVSGGGEWEGSFVDVENDHRTNCRPADRELVYEFTTAVPQDVTIEAAANDGRSLTVAVQSICGDVGSEVRCAYAAPAAMHLYSLDPGTYFLLVESGTENDFVLDVSFGPPTSPPPGDTCDEPIDASGGGDFEGNLGEMEDDIDISCGYHYRDMVFEILLEDTKDVFIESDSTTYTYVSVRTECDNRGTERRCFYGDPAKTTFRSLAAGSYYVVVESYRPVAFDLAIDIEDPAPIVDVEDNEVCDDDSFPIPVPEGGVFRGDTTGMGSDHVANCGFNAGSPDAVFRFELARRTHMEASMNGSSYDAVLHLHRDTCNLIDLVPGGCNDDYMGGEAFLSMDLDADVYFLIVDGFGAASQGAYLLDVQFE